MVGSGLFVASKFPVIAAHFQRFRYRTHYAKFFSFGVLLLKVNASSSGIASLLVHLPNNTDSVDVQVRVDDKRVGYVSNLHGQAYQGKKAVLYHQMSETLDAVNAFRIKTQQSAERETVAFDVLCGDFNFDNLSPADRDTQQHPLFNQYVDVCCRKAGGQDHDWTVGTELRQRRMHEPAVASPNALRRVLIDDLSRRYYVLDADVVEHTAALASCDPLANANGVVVQEPWGGKRRIDRILVRRDSPCRTVGLAFSTSLAVLTDHIPVSLTLKLDDDDNSI